MNVTVYWSWHESWRLWGLGFGISAYGVRVALGPMWGGVKWERDR